MKHLKMQNSVKQHQKKRINQSESPYVAPLKLQLVISNKCTIRKTYRNYQIKKLIFFNCINEFDVIEQKQYKNCEQKRPFHKQKGGIKMLSLFQASLNTCYTIKWCILNDNQMEKLKKNGLIQGAEIKVISSYFGNVIVAVNGRRLALGKDTAARIKI